MVSSSRQLKRCSPVVETRRSRTKAETSVESPEAFGEPYWRTRRNTIANCLEERQAEMAESDDSLEPLIAAGARAWPMLRLDTDVFRAHLQSILTQPDSVEIGSLLVGDLFLACCCAHLPAAIAVFQRKYAGEIESA